MQGLDPVMDGILAKMQEVTDNSTLKSLQQQASAAESEEVVESSQTNEISTGVQSQDEKTLGI